MDKDTDGKEMDNGSRTTEKEEEFPRAKKMFALA
jgi:hypothetical protein